MDTGTIDGDYLEWHENGNVKLKKYCKYGLVLKMQEFDEGGNLLKEKKELSEGEKLFMRSGQHIMRGIMRGSIRSLGISIDF